MALLTKFPSSEYLLNRAVATVRRFPFALLSALLGVVIGVHLANDVAIADRFVEHKLLMVAALGLPLFVALAVFAERRLWSRPVAIACQAAGILVLLMYYLSLPQDVGRPEMHLIRFALLSVGMHFLVAFLPFLKEDAGAAFWQFNKTLFLRFLTAGLYSAVLYIGLTIALAAADYLFGMEVKPERYFQLWIIIAGLFQTTMFLAGVPEKSEDTGPAVGYPVGLKVFTQFILLPLVGLYFVILIAYEAKIIVEWNWPKGWVSQLVLWYSVVGILSLLLLHPLRDMAGNRWIRRFDTWFFRGLIPLVVILILAIIRRISDYGITENRYIVLGMGIGLVVVMLYFLFSRKRDIRIIPIVICLLAFASAYGPWSAFAVSKSSQISRLEGLLIKNKLVVDGKVTEASGEIPFEDKKEMSSIISYVNDHYGLEPFSRWMPEAMLVVTDTLPAYGRTEEITRYFGFEYVSRWMAVEAQNYFSLTIADDVLIDVAGYDYMTRLYNLRFYDTGQSCRIDDDWYVFALDSAGYILSMSVYADSLRETLVERVETPLPESFIELLRTGEGERLPPEYMSFPLEGETAGARLVLENFTGSLKDDSLDVSGMSGRILVRTRKK